jgi:hypothetical protein
VWPCGSWIVSGCCALQHRCFGLEWSRIGADWRAWRPALRFGYDPTFAFRRGSTSSSGSLTGLHDAGSCLAGGIALQLQVQPSIGGLCEYSGADAAFVLRGSFGASLVGIDQFPMIESEQVKDGGV